MEVITSKINKKLKKIIKSKFAIVKNDIEIENKRISHINIYHRDWQNNSCDEIIEILKNDYAIDVNNIISLGFITSQVNCFDQHFHIDYEGKVNTYFIPLIDLDDNNGTEFVKFNDVNLNKNMIDKLINITNDFIDRKDVEKEFIKMNIKDTDYKFCYLNSPKWSIVFMPNYVFHRGQSNKGTQSRTMFQITLVNDNNTNPVISNEVKIYDSELDEDISVISKLIINRL